MSLPQAATETVYPESDGKPMGETDLHRDWMVRIIDLLRYRYRGQRVYVSGDLLVYYEQGSPSRFVVPDAFVVKDCDPGRRRVYKVWEEGKPPDVVFETTSRSTQREDTVFKPQSYARIGIGEYFLYDPASEYLAPPLQGYRLADDGYDVIRPDAAGTLVCEQLGILLRLEDGELVMRDARTGQRLQTSGEAAEARAAEEASARQELESELKRLRDQLKRDGPSD